MSDEMAGQDFYNVMFGAVENDCLFRYETELQPGGGDGWKVFPPTYEGGRHAFEKRRIAGREVDVVLLNSLPAQVNLMEMALLDEIRQGHLHMPLLQADVPGFGTFSTLERSHRIADALFRDSTINGLALFSSPFGQKLVQANDRDLTPFLEVCPQALIYGIWASMLDQGPKWKIRRSVESEVLGLDVVAGVKTSSRMDQFNVLSSIPIYGEPRSKDDKKKKIKFENWSDQPMKGWVLKKPSDVGHGNQVPNITDGGVTISRAFEVSTVSFKALNHLRFAKGGREVRTLLAILAAYGFVAKERVGYDLRSRCLLVPTARKSEIVGAFGNVRACPITLTQVRAAFNIAIAEVRKAGVPWSNTITTCQPMPKVLHLFRTSADLGASDSESDE